MIYSYSSIQFSREMIIWRMGVLGMLQLLYLVIHLCPEVLKMISFPIWFPSMTDINGRMESNTSSRKLVFNISPFDKSYHASNIEGSWNPLTRVDDLIHCSVKHEWYSYWNWTVKRVGSIDHNFLLLCFITFCCIKIGV